MINLQAPDRRTWQHFAEGVADRSLDPVLLRSWRRSTDGGASFEGPPPQAAFVERSELLERQARLDRMRRIARGIIDELVGTLEHTGYVGLITDAEGVILDGFGGGSFLGRAQRSQLTVGAR
ncbi:MAG: hypothetical protein KDC38_08150, partial [Planctomycetes bacterium]|nr:hypothetical protein [Planctomycetota bacterium]